MDIVKAYVILGFIIGYGVLPNSFLLIKGFVYIIIFGLVIDFIGAFEGLHSFIEHKGNTVLSLIIGYILFNLFCEIPQIKRLVPRYFKEASQRRMHRKHEKDVRKNDKIRKKEQKKTDRIDEINRLNEEKLQALKNIEVIEITKQKEQEKEIKIEELKKQKPEKEKGLNEILKRLDDL